MSKHLTKRSENYSKWYNELVVQADLAENSAVRGCMVIKPYGYAIWEKMQKELDKMFKATGHENAYFPLLVPKHLFEAEEKNAEGFAKECAVVTHYRLKSDKNDKSKLIVDPEAKLEEELVIRPTSEAIIWNTYKNWIQSYRDLPKKINQWANVMRWEMRTRLFLRTSEFLWQEGHTAHATKQEAIEEAELMNNIYAKFAEKYMAMPVIKGTKSESEKFAGAVKTYCIEALMQDGKALQAGTSHFLGQNFAKAFDVKYTSKEGKQEYVWATSWGVSTRLMGALIMSHSDDSGLVLPPKLAPYQVVIVPIYRNDEQFTQISEKAQEIINELEDHHISVKFDDRDTHKPGWKFAEYEMKGVPLRIGIGPKDLENNTVELARRDTLNKSFVKQDGLILEVKQTLKDIQNNLYKKSQNFMRKNTHKVESYDEFKSITNGDGGFIEAYWDGSANTEEQIKKDTKATIRCIIDEKIPEGSKCLFSQKKAVSKVLYAKAY
ncbi:proline--tRNA ligase [Mesohalobacter halotolerans]|uniref:Proline--tRNA ligase n=1 Tax=Mesohalobacter halotolerans TaxID=1883405 RepID=A0A4U5TUJ8_9FLAO|nr:proline--tRNA ligase [Mesohalobacter halotolerans]MBS3739203.1 proline--tRNA ligase [Psychroflexus sp.]TKS57621.1 proline--tRNA ligase [Mesohalobacter halotolerans]